MQHFKGTQSETEDTKDERFQNDMNGTSNEDIMDEFIDKVSNLLHLRVNIMHLRVPKVIESIISYMTKHLINKENFDSLKGLLVRIRRRLPNETWTDLPALILFCIDVYIFVAYLTVSVIENRHLFVDLWKK